MACYIHSVGARKKIEENSRRQKALEEQENRDAGARKKVSRGNTREMEVEKEERIDKSKV